MNNKESKCAVSTLRLSGIYVYFYFIYLVCILGFFCQQISQKDQNQQCFSLHTLTSNLVPTEDKSFKIVLFYSKVKYKTQKQSWTPQFVSIIIQTGRNSTFVRDCFYLRINTQCLQQQYLLVDLLLVLLFSCDLFTFGKK